MKFSIPQNYRILLVAAAALIAVNVFISNRSADDLEFQPRQQPDGFRELILSGGTSRPDPAALPLAGVEFGAEQPNTEPVIDFCTALFNDPGDPAAGPADAAVTIVEFFDYQCPYCRVVSSYLGDLRAKDPRCASCTRNGPFSARRPARRRVRHWRPRGRESIYPSTRP